MVTILDGFNDESFDSAWTVYEPGFDDVVENSNYSYEGSGSVEMSLSSGNTGYVSSLPGDGLDTYPSRGSTFSIWYRITDVYPESRLSFGFSGSYLEEDPDRYYVMLTSNTQSIYKVSGGSHSEIANTNYQTSTGEWHKMEVEFGSSTITYRVYNSSGSEIASLSASDTSYNGEGIGFELYNTSSSSTYDGHFDYLTASAEPEAPTNTSLSISNGDDATVTWDDNSGNEDGFHIDRHYDGSWSRAASVGANTTSYSESDLLDGEEYRYRVRAYNSDGSSDWDYSNYETTDLPAPSNTAQSVDSPTAITVSWSDNSDNENQFRINVSEDGGTYSTVTTVGSDTTSYQASVPKSTDTFKFAVRAETEHTESGWDYTGTVSTNADGLAAGATRETEIDLSWNDVDQEDGYYVYRAETSGSTASDYAQVADLAAGTTTWTDTGLENGERYYYRVAAYYGGTADALSAEVDSITDLPAAAWVSLDNSVEDELSLDWSKEDNSSDGEWEVLRSTDGSTGSVLATISDLSQTSYTDTGLADGERYDYTIRRTTDHASSDSAQNSAITVLPAPTGLTVDDVTGDQAAVSWTPNHDSGHQRVEVKPTDEATWTDDSGQLDRTVTEYTTTHLRDGEQYDLRVLAVTEHTTTEDV